MDPLCHTMVGVALSYTGLERKTQYGRATLIIGANLPDIDVFTSYWGAMHALDIRRGYSHGIGALIFLPLILAVMMKLFACIPWRRDSCLKKTVSMGWLFFLAFVGCLSHLFLDFLNTYGIRLLMPFTDRWFYGDILFIIDPYVWVALLIGILWSRYRYHRHRPSATKPAVAALIVALLYVAVNGIGTYVSCRTVSKALLHNSQNPQLRFMASPVFLNPLRRHIVIDSGEDYQFGYVLLFPKPVFAFEPLRIPKGKDPVFDQAAKTQAGTIFLKWARFPFFEAQEDPEGTTVFIMDARYVREKTEGFAAVRVKL